MQAPTHDTHARQTPLQQVYRPPRRPYTGKISAIDKSDRCDSFARGACLEGQSPPRIFLGVWESKRRYSGGKALQVNFDSLSQKI